MKMKNKKSFAILGVGRFSSSVAVSLAKAGCQVHVVDSSEDVINDIKDYVQEVSIGDVTNKDFLNNLGLDDFDAVIIGIGDNLEAGVMATMLAKEAGAKYIIAKAANELNSRIFKKLGADRVIIPEKEAGWDLANKLVYGNYFHAIALSETHSLQELDVPAGWVGKSIIELNLRATKNISVIGIKRNDKMLVHPSPKDPIREKDVLVILGQNEDIDKIIDEGANDL